MESSEVTESDQRRLVETVEMRSRAGELLRKLVADRRQAEQRLSEGRGHDPIKAVTGRSAIDRAIAETRRLISNMDDLLGQLNGEVATLDGQRPQRHSRPASRTRLERAAVS